MNETENINPTPHLNRSKVKQTALEFAATQHFTFTGGKKPRFNRVSLNFLQRIEGRVKAMIADEVKQQPRIGKTLQ
jgi:hypothetical protein